MSGDRNAIKEIDSLAEVVIEVGIWVEGLLVVLRIVHVKRPGMDQVRKARERGRRLGKRTERTLSGRGSV